MIPVAKPYFPNKEKILAAMAKILESGRLMEGENVKTFETEFARFVGTRYAISVNSCTTALEIIYRFIDVKDKEVIVPTNTFLATANAVLFAGGSPVLADIAKGTYGIDIKDVEKRITSKTRAVVVVHIAGFVCENIKELAKLCELKKLKLIEDCAHAMGARYQNACAGSFGFASAFSFYPTKVMTTGTGGMIVTNSEELDTFARSARAHGRGTALNDITNLGNDWFMDEFRAAIGISQLEVLNDFIARRKAIAQTYQENLKGVKGLSVFTHSKDSNPCYYKFPVQIAESYDMAQVKKDIPSQFGFDLESVYWPTCHMQPVYQNLFKYQLGDYPEAEKTLSRQVTLPIHPTLDEQSVKAVIAAVQTYFKHG